MSTNIARLIAIYIERLNNNKEVTKKNSRKKMCSITG